MLILLQDPISYKKSDPPFCFCWYDPDIGSVQSLIFFSSMKCEAILKNIFTIFKKSFQSYFKKHQMCIGYRLIREVSWHLYSHAKIFYSSTFPKSDHGTTQNAYSDIYSPDLYTSSKLRFTHCGAVWWTLTLPCTLACSERDVNRASFSPPLHASMCAAHAVLSGMCPRCLFTNFFAVLVSQLRPNLLHRTQREKICGRTAIVFQHSTRSEPGGKNQNDIDGNNNKKQQQ